MAALFVHWGAPLAHSAACFLGATLAGYDVSVLGWPEGHPLHEEAKLILNERNPNKVGAQAGADFEGWQAGLGQCDTCAPEVAMPVRHMRAGWGGCQQW